MASLHCGSRNSGCGLVNGRIYLGGGQVGNGMCTDRVEVYCPSSDTWTLLNLKLPSKMHSFIFHTLSSHFLAIVGGINYNNTASQHIYNLDLNKHNFSLLGQMNIRRGGSGLKVFPNNNNNRSEFFIFGGN